MLARPWTVSSCDGGFYRIPLNMPDEERFLYWDKFGRPDDSAAIYEYLTDGLARVIGDDSDTWWFDDGSTMY